MKSTCGRAQPSTRESTEASTLSSTRACVRIQSFLFVTLTRAHVRVRVCACACVRVRARARACVRARVRACARARARARARACACVRARVRTCMCACVRSPRRRLHRLSLWRSFVLVRSQLDRLVPGLQARHTKAGQNAGNIRVRTREGNAHKRQDAPVRVSVGKQVRV
eukprot:2816546-Pleurochrysis_carterae.AAC.3